MPTRRLRINQFEQQGCHVVTSAVAGDAASTTPISSSVLDGRTGFMPVTGRTRMLPTLSKCSKFATNKSNINASFTTLEY